MTLLSSLKIRQKTLKDAGVKSSAYIGATHNPTKEVDSIKVLLRQSRYFEGSNVVNNILSLSKLPLNPQLVYFYEIACQNLACYVESANSADKSYKHNMVYVTEKELEELTKVENWTKDEIKKEIFLILESFADDQRELYEEYFHKEVKRKTKSFYVDFYYRLADMDITENSYLT